MKKMTARLTDQVICITVSEQDNCCLNNISPYIFANSMQNAAFGWLFYFIAQFNQWPMRKT